MCHKTASKCTASQVGTISSERCNGCLDFALDGHNVSVSDGVGQRNVDSAT